MNPTSSNSPSLSPSPIAGTRSSSAFAARYGPWALVTGASAGIGRAFAEALAERGLNLVLVARRHDRLVALARELEEKHGVAVDVATMDLSKPTAPRSLDEATASRDVGLLVAAAGVGTSGPFLDSSLTTELAMLDLNARTVADLSYRFGRRFARRGRGGLVLMSSIVAFQGVPGAAHYSATKAYVQSLAEGLAREWAPLNVDVVASAPGPVDSEFAERANMQMGATVAPAVVATTTLAALGRRSITRPGWLSKLLEAGLAVLPRRFRVRMMARVMEGMTRHHDRTQSSPSHVPVEP